MSKIPELFTEYGGAIMSNFDHAIDEDVVKAIKGKPHYAQYAGWNFCRYVWYADDQWHCEVWRYGSPEDSLVSANELEEIMTEVSDSYGWD